MNTTQVLLKINQIEQELEELKNQIKQPVEFPRQKKVGLKGLLKGIKVDETDIQQAKKSLFSRV